MERTYKTADGHTYRQVADEVDVTQGPRLVYDPEWRSTDRNGHSHYWTQLGFPTLRWVPEPQWCEQHQEDHDEGHYECAECGSKIEPGTLVVGGTHRETVSGISSYFIDDEPVDEKTFATRLDAALKT